MWSSLGLRIMRIRGISCVTIMGITIIAESFYFENQMDSRLSEVYKTPSPPSSGFFTLPPPSLVGLKLYQKLTYGVVSALRVTKNKRNHAMWFFRSSLV